MSYIHLEDAELVKLYIKGNESCLVELINRHQQKLFSFIYKKVKNVGLTTVRKMFVSKQCVFVLITVVASILRQIKKKKRQS